MPRARARGRRTGGGTTSGPWDAVAAALFGYIAGSVPVALLVARPPRRGFGRRRGRAPPRRGSAPRRRREPRRVERARGTRPPASVAGVHRRRAEGPARGALRRAR